MLSECRFELFIKIPADDLKKVEENFQILFGLAHLGSPPIIRGPGRRWYDLIRIYRSTASFASQN